MLIKKHRLEKSLFGVLEIVILETQLQIKPKERSKEEKSQWFIKAKATRLLKLSGKDYDWPDSLKDVFVLTWYIVSYFRVKVYKYLEFLEHWADILDAWIKTISGQSSDSIQAEKCLINTSSVA